MPARTTLLIVVLTLLTGILLFFALTSKTNPPQSQNSSSTPAEVEKVEGKAKLYFTPETLDVKLSASPTATVNVMLDSNTHNVTGVQIEALYDPQVLTAVSVKQASSPFFAISNDPTNVLVQEVEPLSGKISYVEGIIPGGKAVNGVGNVATITFRVNPNTTEKTTNIVLLDSSMVTEDSSTHAGASVLGSVSPVTINISK